MEKNSEQSSVNAGESPTRGQKLLEKQEEEMEMFWSYQRQEMEKVKDFQNNALPVTRIKKIMKIDKDVHMVAGESPVLVAKACEFFILDLTLRSWLHSEENQRRILKKKDVTEAIMRTDTFDFLLDVVPGDVDAATGSSTQTFLPFYAAGGQDN